MTQIFRQFTRNIFSGWGALGIRAVIALAVTPVYIHLLGDAHYGIWMLGISIMNYTTLLDFGLRQALERFVSKYFAEKDHDRLNAVIQSAFMMYSFAAIIVILFSVLASVAGVRIFSFGEGDEFTARLVLLIVGIDTAINFMFMAWSGSLRGFQRYDIVNGILIGENILKAAALVYLLKSGYGLLVFASVFPVFSLVRNIVSVIVLKAKFPEVKFGLSKVTEEAVRQIYRFGGIALLISLGWIFIDNMDRILIGYFLGMEPVTTYSVAIMVIVFMRQGVLAVSLPLRPLVSTLEASGQMDTIRKIHLIGTKYLAWVSFTFAAGVFIFAKEFVYLWMGPGYGEAAKLMKLMAFPFALYFTQAVSISIFYGIERHKYLLYLLLAEGISNLVLSVILVRWYGVTGIVLGTIIPQIPVYFILMPMTLSRILGTSFGSYFLTLVKGAFFASALTMAAALLMRQAAGIENWLMLSANVAAVSAFSAYGCIMILGKRDLAMLKDYYRHSRTIRGK